MNITLHFVMLIFLLLVHPSVIAEEADPASSPTSPLLIKATPEMQAINLYNMAMIAAKGASGTNPRLPEAVKLFRESAELGYAPSQYSLGFMFNEGYGVKQDFVQAVSWYRKAAVQGYAKAQFNLGNMYGNGQGVPQDYVQAVAWYRKDGHQCAT